MELAGLIIAVAAFLGASISLIKLSRQLESADKRIIEKIIKGLEENKKEDILLNEETKKYIDYRIESLINKAGEALSESIKMLKDTSKSL